VTRRGTKLPVLLLVSALVAAATSCGQSTSSSSTEGLDLIKEGKLTVCTHLDYPPFQARKGEPIVGFDVDVVDQIAKDLGVTQEIIDTSFEGIESGESLETRQCDLAAAAMTITDKRKEKLAFSDPYFDAEQALLVKKGSGIKSLADLRGKKVGVQLATTGEDYTESNKDANGYEIVQFEDLPLEVTAVQTGQLDAAVNDNSVLRDYIKDHDDVEIAAEFNTGEKYGFGMRKNNTKLVEKVNASLARIKKDGEYDKIYEKWIGPKTS
jgi:polar amino acid transport system substrate-binding protein